MRQNIVDLSLKVNNSCNSKMIQLILKVTYQISCYINGYNFYAKSFLTC